MSSEIPDGPTIREPDPQKEDKSARTPIFKQWDEAKQFKEASKASSSSNEESKASSSNNEESAEAKSHEISRTRGR